MAIEPNEAAAPDEPYDHALGYKVTLTAWAKLRSLLRSLEEDHHRRADFGKICDVLIKGADAEALAPHFPRFGTKIKRRPRNH